MAISIEIPGDIEDQLRQELDNLDQAAKEVFLVELYRRRKLTHAQLARALDLSRYDTDGVLKRYGVFYDTTLEEVLHDAAVSRQARAE